MKEVYDPVPSKDLAFAEALPAKETTLRVQAPNDLPANYVLKVKQQDGTTTWAQVVCQYLYAPASMRTDSNGDTQLVCLKCSTRVLILHFFSLVCKQRKNGVKQGEFFHPILHSERPRPKTWWSEAIFDSERAERTDDVWARVVSQCYA